MVGASAPLELVGESLEIGTVRMGDDSHRVGRGGHFHDLPFAKRMRDLPIDDHGRALVPSLRTVPSDSLGGRAAGKKGRIAVCRSLESLS